MHENLRQLKLMGLSCFILINYVNTCRWYEQERSLLGGFNKSIMTDLFLGASLETYFYLNTSQNVAKDKALCDCKNVISSNYN